MSESSPGEICYDPSDAQILSAAAAVVAGDALPALGDYVERVFFVERPEDLEHPKLRFLYGYWSGLAARKPGGRVARQDVDVTELKVALGNLLLLDVEREGLDAVYRVYGSGVADQAGRDWTGWRVSEMNRQARTPLALLYRACYRAVWETGRPLFSLSKSPPWLPARAWQRLILPLFGPDGDCRAFLVGNVPVEPRHISYEDRQKIRKRHQG
ncbi:PAS domain-containing protein [Tistlia consotensis]|uniref:PAS domain-containing protein n=1 Tax=Tistlia consotensis USBA 355 TaxID=560819 RepID=A0A1Y6C8E0_9PROT|nr:PAS domain-containing protein [Tistlia consotensis]SMF51423.1 PAS domain-containing protein [Tistlia consotensis USBA 355]SNR84336.1 PAS domain-containing protein [Tistlia consotensis]